MVTSLSELCSRASGVASFVIQGERRQTPDRRRTRRGGRRADDVEQALDPIDMRAVAIRRASTNVAFTAVSRSYDAAAPSIDVAARRLVMDTGRGTTE